MMGKVGERPVGEFAAPSACIKMSLAGEIRPPASA